VRFKGFRVLVGPELAAACRQQHQVQSAAGAQGNMLLVPHWEQCSAEIWVSRVWGSGLRSLLHVVCRTPWAQHWQGGEHAAGAEL
jgi:hypothetical protein